MTDKILTIGTYEYSVNATCPVPMYCNGVLVRRFRTIRQARWYMGEVLAGRLTLRPW